MARLVYEITGNVTGLLQATKQATANLYSLEQSATRSNSAISKEITSITQLKRDIVELNKQKVNFVDEAKLARQNKLIQELEAELKRADNIGKIGFDNVGVAIKNTGTEAEKTREKLRKIYDPSSFNNLSNEIKATTSSVSGLNGIFSSLSGGIISSLAPLALLTAGLAAAKAVFSNNVNLSDEFVDVQRTAKLSAEEVDGLGEALKRIDTRTPLSGLLDIAFIGGRLGVAKNDLVGFVTTVDQLSVVLKKEFPGGADAVATALGKIISVYKITQREGISLDQALKNTGSTFLELAHSGQVNVQYLQDFALRTAGIAQVAKITLPTMLAYGAVLSQAGISAQVAGTSLTRLISNLSTKRQDFFAIAQLADSTLTLQKFTDLINRDTKSALELFFKGLKAGNPTQTEFSDRLKTLSLTTGAAKNAVIALAENQDSLFQKTALANKANAEGTSVAHNFELANNSLSASIDKIGNSISNAFTSSSFARSLATFLNGITSTKTEAAELAEVLQKNKHANEQLEASLNPLVKRYDELKGKSSLTTIEQTELRDITAKIGALLPNVTTRFDEYGNSLDINRKKITDLTKAQRELLLAQNRDVLKKANQEFNVQEQPKRLIQASLAGAFGETDKGRLRDELIQVLGRQYELAKTIRDIGGKLTKSQQDVINYFEKLDQQRKPKKVQQTIVGDGVETGIIDDGIRTIDDIKADIKRVTELKRPLDVASKQYKEYVLQLKAFKAELKAAMGLDSSPKQANFSLVKEVNLRQQLDDIISKSKKTASESGLEGYALDLKSIQNTYLALNKEINLFISNVQAQERLYKKTGGKQGLNPTLSASLIDEAKSTKAGLVDPFNKEISDARIKEEKRVANEITRIRNDFGVKVAEDKAKELLAIQARYDSEVVKAKGNSEILSAIDEGRVAAVQAVNDKYEAIQNDLQSKILGIQETTIAKLTGREEDYTNKIDKEWENRRAALNKYYADLLKITTVDGNFIIPGVGGSSDFVSGLLKNQQGKDNSNIDSGFAKELNNYLNKDFNNALKGVTRGFVDNLRQGLFNATSQAGANFASVFSSITASFSQTVEQGVFSVLQSQLEKKLQEGIDKGTGGLSKALQAQIAGLAIAGGLISGLTPKTSSVGQGLGGALSGAAAGAAVGSVIPGIGTAIGAAVGGIAGALGGIFGASAERKKLQEQQLAEAQKQTELLRQSIAYTSSIIGRMTVNGIVSGVDVNAFGEIKLKVEGKDLVTVINRATGR